MTEPASPLYIGRFAPSPSGPLHFGSLVSALASYLDAHANGGRWLVRIEDLDPPREQVGAAATILSSLQAHGLHWDGDVLYQSTRLNAYASHLITLLAAELAYPCACSRQHIQAMGGLYNGRCRNGLPTPANRRPQKASTAIRLKVHDLPERYRHQDTEVTFTDLFQGVQRQHLAREVGDFIIRRGDGLFAYQLAVVADDIEQGVTHIIRGSDLLGSSARQIFLFRLLGAEPPRFGHVPVVVDASGQKLSKQNGAPPLVDSRALDNLVRALATLHMPVPAAVRDASIEELLHWAITHWHRQHLPTQMRR